MKKKSKKPLPHRPSLSFSATVRHRSRGGSTVRSVRYRFVSERKDGGPISSDLPRSSVPPQTIPACSASSSRIFLRNLTVTFCFSFPRTSPPAILWQHTEIFYRQDLFSPSRMKCSSIFRVGKNPINKSLPHPLSVSYADSSPRGRAYFV